MADLAAGPGDRPHVLLTGAAGAVGSVLAGPLSAAGRLRQADLRVPAAGPTATDLVADDLVVGDLADPAVAARAVDGVDAVVHLAGDPRPDAPWDDLVRSNVRTTAVLLDAAAAAGVQRLVLASSVHVTGGYGDPVRWPVAPSWPARPCCRYGASKATTELLAQLFAADRPGVSVVALRLGLVADRPRWTGERLGWTPSGELAPLVAAALRARPGYQVHFGVAPVDRPRYLTGSLADDLGHTMRDPLPAAGPLPDEPPAYAPGCRLWRLAGPSSA